MFKINKKLTQDDIVNILQECFLNDNDKLFKKNFKAIKKHMKENKDSNIVFMSLISTCFAEKADKCAGVVFDKVLVTHYTNNFPELLNEAAYNGCSRTWKKIYSHLKMDNSTKMYVFLNNLSFSLLGKQHDMTEFLFSEFENYNTPPPKPIKVKGDEHMGFLYNYSDRVFSLNVELSEISTHRILNVVSEHMANKSLKDFIKNSIYNVLAYDKTHYHIFLNHETVKKQIEKMNGGEVKNIIFSFLKYNKNSIEFFLKNLSSDLIEKIKLTDKNHTNSDEFENNKKSISTQVIQDIWEGGEPKVLNKNYVKLINQYIKPAEEFIKDCISYLSCPTHKLNQEKIFFAINHQLENTDSETTLKIINDNFDELKKHQSSIDKLKRENLDIKNLCTVMDKITMQRLVSKKDKTKIKRKL